MKKRNIKTVNNKMAIIHEDVKYSTGNGVANGF